MSRNACGLMLCSVLVGCSWFGGGSQLTAEASGFKQDLRPVGKTIVYECHGYDFTARLGPGEMALWLEDRYVILSQVRAASGVRYEEGDTVFWSKGDEASLTVDGQRYPGCLLAPKRVPWEDARRRGVDFRAVGNEPGWYLEIQRGRQLLFVQANGMQRVLIPAPLEGEVEGSLKYSGVSGENRIDVEVVSRFCTDTMSGERFNREVTLMYNGKRFFGCGRVLEQPWK